MCFPLTNVDNNIRLAGLMLGLEATDIRDSASVWNIMGTWERITNSIILVNFIQSQNL